MNPTVIEFQRTFANEIKRLNELERKQSTFRPGFLFTLLGFALNQAVKAEVYVRQQDPSTPYSSTRSQVEFDQLDVTLSELEGRILQMNSSQEALNRRFLELNELRHVLRETAAFFQVVGLFNHLLTVIG